MPLDCLRTTPTSLAPLPSQPRGAARPRCRSAVVVVAALLLAACSGSGDEITEPGSTASTARGTEATASTSTTSTSTTTSTTARDGSQPDGQELVDRYVGFWHARLVANEAPPNPDDPALAEFATGPQLDNVMTETRQRLDDGLALRSADPSRTSHDVTVINQTADRAELQDCFVNDGIVYRPDTGEVIDDSVVTRSVSADMVLVDGVWKLERATVVQQWEGIAGCALAD